MSPFGRPRVESRVFARALPIMPDRNERLISYVPTIVLQRPPFKKKKKGETTQDLAADSLPPCQFSCFVGAQWPLPRKATHAGPRWPQSRDCPAPPHLHPCINLILWAHMLLHLPNCTSRCGSDTSPAIIHKPSLLMSAMLTKIHERPHILHDHDQALFPIFLFSPHSEKNQNFLKLQDNFPSLLVYCIH